MAAFIKSFYKRNDMSMLELTPDFADPKLAYIRDLFVFASFTALSFVDIKELTNDRIVEVNGEKWIISKRHKTGVPFQVKLLDIPLQIIERYRPFQENDFVFPNLNYWSICKPLKKMIRECGVNKDISFHCSRHGFATLALCKGMPIESVSRILGHTNIETTQIYAKYCPVARLLASQGGEVAGSESGAGVLEAGSCIQFAFLHHLPIRLQP